MLIVRIIIIWVGNNHHLLLFFSLVFYGYNCCSLLFNSDRSTFTSSLVLHTSSLHLFSQILLSCLFGLGLVDVVHQDSFVFEDVTLGFHVQGVVEMPVDLASLTVLSQQPTQDTLTSHPKDLGGHTGLSGTLSLTRASVTSLGLGGMHGTCACTRVNGDGPLEDESILVEFADGLT